MTSFLATVGAYVSIGLLLAAGVSHAGRPRHFLDALREQHVFPTAVLPTVVVGLTSFELAVGGAGVAAIAKWQEAMRIVLVASGLFYTAATTYMIFLVRQRQGVPCGCSRSAEPVNLWVPVRTGLLATAAYLAAIAPHTVLPLSASSPRVFISLLASLTFGVLLWNLPTAMDDEFRTWSSVERGIDGRYVL